MTNWQKETSSVAGRVTAEVGLKGVPGWARYTHHALQCMDECNNAHHLERRLIMLEESRLASAGPFFGNLLPSFRARQPCALVLLSNFFINTFF
jgi:hypothetical protein